MERERIARELHDTLLQGFQGLVLRFQAVLKQMPSEAPARVMLEKALDRADDVLQEGRLRVRDLRVAGTPSEALPQALALCAHDLAPNAQSVFSLEVIGNSRELNPALSDDVYAIGREALANAFAHSCAKFIKAELTYGRSALRLSVKDDGNGISQDVVNDGRAGHWGFASMRERSRDLGCTLNIWSLPGEGTEIDLSVPAKLAYVKSTNSPLWSSVLRRLGIRSTKPPR